MLERVVESMIKRLGFWLIGMGILIGVGGVGWYVTMPVYTVYAGEEIVQVRGRYEYVEDVVGAAGLVVGEAERVQPPLTAEITDAEAIQIFYPQIVTMTVNGQTNVYETHVDSLGAFLAETGELVVRTDRVMADGLLVPYREVEKRPLPQTVSIDRFTTVTIYEGGHQRTIRTGATTVGGALLEAGITIFAADAVVPAVDKLLQPEMVIEVQRSRPVVIEVDGERVQTRSQYGRVGDILAEAGIGLVGEDYTRPDINSYLGEGETIYIIRVTEDFYTVDESIPYDVVYQGTDQFEIDNYGLLTAGTAGIKRQRYRVRYENGIEVSQTLDGEWVAREPVNEVMGYGTRIEIRTVQTTEGPVQYWRKVRMRVTSYSAATSGKPPDHPAYGITRSGLPSGQGVVAVDPRVVPFMSNVYVRGYGVAIAGDTGGGVLGRWIDLGYPDGEFYGDFPHWSGYTDVYYLTPVPSPDKINYRIPTVLP
ncbi:MAG TPA: ubiquitin-like domain-containing protein [Anaerolineae bacterium]|nr:ubiquitin-like domain-containing protein [Anaerolineae bacterium]